MKKYILFAFQIINMGGEQQYCRNKLLAMELLGYQINLISSDKGHIYINYLKKFENNLIQELRYQPFCFTKKCQKKVLQRIEQIVGSCDRDTIIESVNPATAEWAELFAKKHNCKHFCFLLDEGFTISPSEFDFFNFKLKRKELFGMDKSTLKLLFSGYKNIQDNENFVFDATCTNVVADEKFKNLSFLNMRPHLQERINIAVFSRLEKSFVVPAASRIVDFCREHDDKSFNIFFIGGSDTGKIEKIIQRLFKNIKNVSLLITGYIYPVPLELIKALDIVISTAATALITAVDYDIPTITVDTNTAEPIGILDYTTTELMYAERKNDKDLGSYISDIVFDDFCLKNKHIGMNGSKNDDVFISEMKNQLEAALSNVTCQYYDVSSLKPHITKYRLYALIGKIFGAKILYFIHMHFLRNFKRLLTKNN